ncbi:MAG: response regulator transcription factor [Pseudomonadota bacterium]
MIEEVSKAIKIIPSFSLSIVDTAQQLTDHIEWKLPGGSGLPLIGLDLSNRKKRMLKLCHDLSISQNTGPIILFDSKYREGLEIEGLEAGATYYFGRPFNLLVLNARLKAVHGRISGHTAEKIYLGDYWFFPNKKTLVTTDSHNRKIRLTEKETAILRVLYTADGSRVSRDRLLDRVWGYNAGVTVHTLETHIYRLRQKIEPDPSDCTIIMTDSDGYKLAIPPNTDRLQVPGHREIFGSYIRV